jgi:hypothetical protein
MRDRDEIVRVAKALVAELEELTDEDHVELLLQRLHDAKRGFPTGGTPPMAVDDVDEDGNPTTSAAGHSDRTGQLATDNARDLANSDRRDLARLVDQMGQIRKRVGVLRERYGAIHHNHQCVECRKAGGNTRVDRGRYKDRCRFHGDARLANGGRDTPIAITEAHLCGYLTDELITRNPIRILDEDGNDTGRTVAWKRRRKAKGNAA